MTIKASSISFTIEESYLVSAKINSNNMGNLFIYLVAAHSTKLLCSLPNLG